MGGPVACIGEINGTQFWLESLTDRYRSKPRGRWEDIIKMYPNNM
jgi:hypothetical protein